MWTNKFLTQSLVIFLCLTLGFCTNSYALEENDRTLLTKVQEDSAKYFIRLSDKKTGLTKDSSRQGTPASIAATGFSLAAFAIGATHGWIDKKYAKAYLTKTLKTLLRKAEHEKGFFYHFLDPRTGKRTWGSEASSIDTALLVAGALLAAQYYPGTNIEKMANAIYERVDWNWMMNDSDLICMGWTPESGFLPYYWDSYNELIILQALAIGSPTHPIPAEAWDAWFRNSNEYNEKEIIHSHSGSLFTYQYSHAFIDFRNLNDKGINYFENSRLATLANREYSLAAKNEYTSYSANSWGLSAAVGPGGYKAYGAKPGEGIHDGTIAVHAAIGSIVFTPELSINAINFFYNNYKENLYGMFGFKDSFNLDKKWWANEYLGIDQGIIVLMLENYLQDGNLWKKFHELESIQKWIDVTGLAGTTST